MVVGPDRDARRGGGGPLPAPGSPAAAGRSSSRRRHQGLPGIRSEGAAARGGVGEAEWSGGEATRGERWRWRGAKPSGRRPSIPGSDSQSFLFRAHLHLPRFSPARPQGRNRNHPRAQNPGRTPAAHTAAQHGSGDGGRQLQKKLHLCHTTERTKLKAHCFGCRFWTWLHFL